MPGMVPAAGPLVYPISPEMMFAQMAGGSATSCQQAQDRSETSTSVMDHPGEVGWTDAGLECRL